MPRQFFKRWLRRFFGRLSNRSFRSRSLHLPFTSLRVEALETRLVMAASLNQAFIASAYQVLLGRAADPSGLSFWSQQLNQGVTATSVVSEITDSTEYKTRELTQFYQEYLHRNPDQAGLTYWFQQLDAGTTWEQVEATIAGSPEHYQYVGQYVSSDVANLFQNTLDRPLDDASSSISRMSPTTGFRARTSPHR